MNKSRRIHLPELLLLLAAAILLLALLAVTVAPALLQLRSFVVTSESMSPTLERGDLIYVRPTAFEAIHPGNIIAFTVEGSTVTHRVYSLDLSTRTLRTKADAGNRLDSVPIEESWIVGVVVYKLPKLGFLSLSLGSKEGENS